MRLSAVNCITKSWSTLFKNGIVYNRVVLNCICATVSRQYNQLFYNFFYQSNWIWKVNGRLQFQKYPTHQCTKMSRRESLYFLTRNFQSRQNSTIWTLIFSLPLQILLKPGTLWFKNEERHNHIENCITIKVCRRTQKVEIYLANEGSGLAFFSTDLGHIFRRNVGNEFGVMLREKGPHKPEFAYDIVRIHSLMIHTDMI